MAQIYSLVSRDAQQALTEFSMQFDGALAANEAIPWSEQLGLTNSSKAIRTVYPIPLSAAGYTEFKGDMVYRSLYERSLSMKIVQWQDGVAELARIVEAPDFIGWAGEPGRIAVEARRQPNLLVSALLHNNPYLDVYRVEHEGGSTASTIRMFATNHPVNIFDTSFGTFQNQWSYVVDTKADWATMFAAIKTRFRTRKAPNGRVGKWQFDTLLIPAALEEEARQFLATDLLISALSVTNKAGLENVAAVPVQTKNIYSGSVNLVVAPELEDDSIIYPISSGSMPWVVQNGGAPEEILSDKTSDLYKRSLKVGVSYILDMAAAGALPHGIEQVTITRS